MIYRVVTYLKAIQFLSNSLWDQLQFTWKQWIFLVALNTWLSSYRVNWLIELVKWLSVMFYIHVIIKKLLAKKSSSLSLSFSSSTDTIKVAFHNFDVKTYNMNLILQQIGKQRVIFIVWEKSILVDQYLSRWLLGSARKS